MAGDRAGHNIACQERVDDLLACAVNQKGAVASQGFGEEVGGRAGQVESCGVELHKLEISQVRARPPGQHKANAPVAPRIG